MCTITIFRKQDGYLLTMNRDERRDREEEIPPQMQTTDPGLMMPKDPVGGGTWIGVNAHGVSACLLNGYHEADYDAKSREKNWESRGLIIPKILEAPLAKEAVGMIGQQLDLTRYRSFTLFVVDQEDVFQITHFIDHPLTSKRLKDPELFFSSSSWKADEVLPYRAELFRKWQESGREFFDEIPAIHLYQAEGKEEWTPLMSREKSCTKSVTQVNCTEGKPLRMNYARTDQPSDKLHLKSYEMGSSS